MGGLGGLILGLDIIAGSRENEEESEDEGPGERAVHRVSMVKSCLP